MRCLHDRLGRQDRFILRGCHRSLQVFVLRACPGQFRPAPPPAVLRTLPGRHGRQVRPRQRRRRWLALGLRETCLQVRRGLRRAVVGRPPAWCRPDALARRRHLRGPVAGGRRRWSRRVQAQRRRRVCWNVEGQHGPRPRCLPTCGPGHRLCGGVLGGRAGRAWNGDLRRACLVPRPLPPGQEARRRPLRLGRWLPLQRLLAGQPHGGAGRVLQRGWPTICRTVAGFAIAWNRPMLMGGRP
mmetsp:Transcript_83055/g.211395  ORF Transcript_83055/g.211395 Transcript_83055/m.211395 type:complete len:241 (-) Transcript_83055:274-996(-)